MKKIAIISTIFLLPFVVSASTLSLSPSSQSINVGDTFTVNINLDTQNASVDGVDLRYLTFNPSLLQVIDANGSASGVQIAPGSLMPMTLANSVDNSSGRITFSQVVAGGNKYKGSGTLASITFKALASGGANVDFSYTSGNTTDSNVAANGSDTLSSVVNGSFTINTQGGSSSGGSSGGGSSSGGGGGGSSSGGGSGVSNAGIIGVVNANAASALARNLYKGISGDDVKVLQQFLVNRGYTTADNITGFFGPATESALKKFQAAEGLVSSGDPFSTGYGFAGPNTRAKINQYLGSGAATGVATGLTPAQVSAIKAQIAILQQQVLQLLLKLQTLKAAGL